MSGAGFRDEWSARRAMRRILLRERLRLIEASATGLLDRLDHISQDLRDRYLAGVDSVVDLAERNLEGSVRRVPVDQVESQDVREQELLQGADLMLQLLNALNEGVSHGLFSGLSRAEPTAAECAAHSKIEGQK